MNRVELGIMFRDWKFSHIPMGVEAKLICRGALKNDWLYRLCIWALKKYCRVEVIG